MYNFLLALHQYWMQYDLIPNWFLIFSVNRLHMMHFLRRSFWMCSLRRNRRLPAAMRMSTLESLNRRSVLPFITGTLLLSLGKIRSTFCCSARMPMLYLPSSKMPTVTLYQLLRSKKKRKKRKCFRLCNPSSLSSGRTKTEDINFTTSARYS